MLHWLYRLKKNKHVTDPSRHPSLYSKNPKIVGITCGARTDGGGAQVHGVMSAIAFAQCRGLQYYHTPFASVEHGLDAALFASEWENAFQLGVGFPTIPQGIPIIDGNAVAKGYDGPPAIVRQPYFHGYVEKHLHLYSRHAQRWRENLKLPGVSKSGRTVAIHIRRGDVGGDQRSRFTSNEVILRHFQNARTALPDARVVVLSQGEEKDFQWLGSGCELLLNRDIFETISIMVGADELIMAKSSLSYVCGILSEGVVYYQPFMHGPMSSWRVLQ